MPDTGITKSAIIVYPVMKVNITAVIGKEKIIMVSDRLLMHTMVNAADGM